MKAIKMSEYTPFLLMGFGLVIIAEHFYEPWGGFDFWAYANQNMVDMVGIEKLPPQFETYQEQYQWLVSYIMPVLSSLADFTFYICYYTIIDKTGSPETVLFAGELTVLTYIVILHYLEKFHGKLHEEEGLFSLCIDMLCVEHIVMFFFNAGGSIISDWICSINIQTDLTILLDIVLGAVAIVAVQFYIEYLFAGFVITVLVPTVISLPVAYISEEAAILCLLAFLLIFSQIVWRMVSDKIYERARKKVIDEAVEHWKRLLQLVGINK